jgi:Tol biopolymer transport system component
MAATLQDGGAISEMNADGTDVRQVPITGPLCCSYPALSPDGTRLVFTSEGALSVANADGTQAEAIWTSGTASAFEPTWSPSGDRIAFWESGVDASGALILQDLDVVEADGSGNPRVVLANEDLEAPDAEASGLAWSPDGTELAFVSSTGGIDVVSVSSGAVHSILGSEEPVAPDESAVVALTWAPGPKLLFEAAGVTGYIIEEVNGDGSDVRPLLPGAGHISPSYSSPSWGPDGVHFSAIRDGRVVIATVDQGVQEVLPPRGVIYAQWG